MAPILEPMALPPNFTPELFERFILGAQEICGAENVRVVPKDGPRRRRPARARLGNALVRTGMNCVPMPTIRYGMALIFDSLSLQPDNTPLCY
ncbi:vanillyl-alcohol oxidase [Colletotrichum tabaci]|uniref:Vanillyl-alcohol oxidase n=1 Tax=Colletotrichum tabaci TaxID=1209068 RepID=A0AAV9T7E7_9PEZI